MKLATIVPAGKAPMARIASRVADMERAGLDVALVAEGYSFDAVSRIGFLAARTERLVLGTGIVNVFSRTPAALAQTAAGCDYVSGGRFVLGLGTSGPQVIEGFHGLPYEQPRSRVLDVIEVVRAGLRGERLSYAGPAVTVPLPDGAGRPLKLIHRPLRDAVPIWWAAIMERSVRSAAAVADGWAPLMFVPEAAHSVWGGALAAGRAERAPSLGPLEVIAGGKVAIGERLPVDSLLDAARVPLALYIGGMGPRHGNFYNAIVSRAGYEQEAMKIQDLYLAGHREEAAAAVPRALLEQLHLIGPRGLVAERVAAYRAAGVTTLLVEPAGPDPVATIAELRSIVDSAR
jgi:F420-dependent oxidoreductase-like protein